MKKLLFILAFVLLSFSVAAYVTPYDDFDMRKVLGMYNATNVTSMFFCDLEGNCYTISQLAAGGGGNTTEEIYNAILSNQTFQFEIGADCSPGDFVKGVDDDGTLDCSTPVGGGAGGGDKWLDDGDFISPNATFAAKVNATFFTSRFMTNISGGIINTSVININGTDLTGFFITVDNPLNSTSDMANALDNDTIVRDSELVLVNSTLFSQVWDIFNNFVNNTLWAENNETLKRYVGDNFVNDSEITAFNQSVKDFVNGSYVSNIGDEVTANYNVSGLLNITNITVRDVNALGYIELGGVRETAWPVNTTDQMFDAVDNLTFQYEIGADCSPGDFVKGVDNDGTLDCDTPVGGGGGGDKFIDDGDVVSPNSTFGYGINATLITSNSQTNISNGLINTSVININGTDLAALFLTYDNPLNSTTDMFKAVAYNSTFPDLYSDNTFATGTTQSFDEIIVVRLYADEAFIYNTSVVNRNGTQLNISHNVWLDSSTSGKVMVGSPRTPFSELEVVGNINGTQLCIAGKGCIADFEFNSSDDILAVVSGAGYGDLFGSGSNGYITRWNGTNSVNISTIYTTGSAVSIGGDLTPDRLLDVDGNFTAGTIFANGGRPDTSEPISADLVLGASANGYTRHNGSIMFWTDANAARLRMDDTGGSPRLHVQAWDSFLDGSFLPAAVGGISYFSGYTGIGTTSPNQNLEVRGGVNISGGLNVTGNVSAQYFIGDGSQLTGISSGSGDVIGAGASNRIAVWNSTGTINASSMLYEVNQKMGVNQSSPTYGFQVNTTFRLTEAGKNIGINSTCLNLEGPNSLLSIC